MQADISLLLKKTECQSASLKERFLIILFARSARADFGTCASYYSLRLFEMVPKVESPLVFYNVTKEVFTMSMQTDAFAVSRKEVKYLLSLPDRLFLLDVLDRLLIPDVYGGYNGYTVRSVYFDSIINEDYRDKMEHADEKKRIRIRIYHPDDQKVKFELKRKSFGRELKESVIISKEDAVQLLKRNYGVLLHYNSEVAHYAYELMTARLYRPVSLIEYDRRAFTHPNFNTRITMDNNLRYCDFCYDLFSHCLNFKSALSADKTILEIKYDRFLFRQIQDVLAQCDLTRTPPSKFGSSRAVLKYFYA